MHEVQLKSFEDGNPFKLKLAELLISTNPSALTSCVGKTLCFFDGMALKSFKVKQAKRQGGSAPIPQFCLEGPDGAKAVIDVLESKGLITNIKWSQKATFRLWDQIQSVIANGSVEELEIELTL